VSKEKLIHLKPLPGKGLRFKFSREIHLAERAVIRVKGAVAPRALIYSAPPRQSEYVNGFLNGILTAA